jgi:hypothetical protein
LHVNLQIPRCLHRRLAQTLAFESLRSPEGTFSYGPTL